MLRATLSITLTLIGLGEAPTRRCPSATMLGSHGQRSHLLFGNVRAGGHEPPTRDELRAEGRSLRAAHVRQARRALPGSARGRRDHPRLRGPRRAAERCDPPTEGRRPTLPHSPRRRHPEREVLQGGQDHKEGRRPPERVRVYEKLRKGIWSYNGAFTSWTRGRRKTATGASSSSS